MPFTPSHAVIAIPFIRTPLVPAAIAVGAMTPDLPLFVRGLPLHYGRTHDLAWIVPSVVLAGVLLLVWRCVLRPAARELAPSPLARRLPTSWDAGAAASARETLAISGDRGSRTVSWRGIALRIASLAIGIVSHIVWDLFTHEGRAGVILLPALADTWGPLLGYKWVQHGSSALGMVLIAVWAAVWVSKRDAAPVPARVLPVWVRTAWWLSLPIVLVVAWMWGLGVLGPLDEVFTAAHLAYRVLPPACAVWAVLTVVLCLITQWRRKVSAGA